MEVGGGVGRMPRGRCSGGGGGNSEGASGMVGMPWQLWRRRGGGGGQAGIVAAAEAAA